MASVTWEVFHPEASVCVLPALCTIWKQHWESYLQVHKCYLIVPWHEKLNLRLSGESRLKKAEATQPLRAKHAEFEQKHTFSLQSALCEHWGEYAELGSMCTDNSPTLLSPFFYPPAGQCLVIITSATQSLFVSPERQWCLKNTSPETDDPSVGGAPRWRKRKTVKSAGFWLSQTSVPILVLLCTICETFIASPSLSLLSAKWNR